MSTNVIERFLKYIKINSTSDEHSSSFPSTECQRDMAEILYKDLKEIGLSKVVYDKENCYVYATIPATDESVKETVGFVAHMDTSPDMSGENVNPQIIENYDGEDILLNKELNIVLSVTDFPYLKDCIGKTIITTDGTTLLGADDKAGIAEIMSMAEYLVSHPEIPHGKIAIAFTPDEEVGAGVDRFNIEIFGADYAYTVDGSSIGEIEFENFNAASALLKVNGRNIHPGAAKGKMKNASLIMQEFISSLPENERPENTEGYEGFYHLLSLNGCVENCTAEYIIRDHDREKFEKRKNLILSICEKINNKYGCCTITAEIKDSYYNMRQKIEPDFMFLIERAILANKASGIEPKILPIRGGTDGARLSYMGVPCPNLSTGAFNGHSRYEYACAEYMDQIVKVLIKIACSINK